jgi:hypothetical protein
MLVTRSYRFPPEKGIGGRHIARCGCCHRHFPLVGAAACVVAYAKQAKRPIHAGSARRKKPGLPAIQREALKEDWVEGSHSAILFASAWRRNLLSHIICGNVLYPGLGIGQIWELSPCGHRWVDCGCKTLKGAACHAAAHKASKPKTVRSLES